MGLPILSVRRVIGYGSKADGEGFDSVAASSIAASELHNSASEKCCEFRCISTEFGQIADGCQIGDHKSTEIDPDLALLIDCWPTLPADVRQRIVALLDHKAEAPK